MGTTGATTIAAPSVPNLSAPSAVEQVRSDRHYRGGRSHWRGNHYSYHRRHHRSYGYYGSYQPGFSFYLGTPRHRYGEYSGYRHNYY